MSLFRRKHRDSAADVPEEGSLEEMEQNPQLLAAEDAVKSLPPPPPSSNVLKDVFMGTGSQVVISPDEEPDLPT